MLKRGLFSFFRSNGSHLNKKEVEMNKQYIYPKNKEHFKKLIPFAQKIIKLCKDNRVEPIIYGSFAHFYHTKDGNNYLGRKLK